MSQINNSNKEAKIVLLIVMFFVILAVVTIAFVVTERNFSHFFSSESMVSDADRDIPAPVSEAEKKAINDGFNKTVAGKVVSIDKNQRSLVIDEDPFGEHKELQVSTTNKTKVSIIYEEEESAKEEMSEGEEQLSIQEDVATEKSETDFDFIEVDRMIEVTFAKRVDIDSSDLVAEEIVILPN